jgi:hypothetical protein
MDKLTYKKLFIYFVTIIFFFIFLDLLFGLFIKYFSDNNEFTEINFINESNPKNLILGSSTSKYSINPNLFDNFTYNASKNGEGLIYSYVLFNNIKNKQNMNFILLSIDPIDLTNNYDSKNDISTLLKIIFFKKNKIVDEFLKLNINYPNYLNNFNLYKYRFFPYFFLDQIRVLNNKNGYFFLTGSNVNTFDLINKEPKSKCTNNEISKKNLIILNKMFDDAKKNNLKLIFHVTPLYAYSQVNNIAYRSLNICNEKIIKKLSQLIKINQQCNLTKNYPEKFIKFSKESDYFYDNAHINKFGADFYTKMLKEWIYESCKI